MVNDKPHCGMCNCEWTEGHENTPKHLKLKASFDNMMKNNIRDDRIVRKTLHTESEVEDVKETSMFKSIEQAYCVVEMYDYGTVDRRMYRNACRYVFDIIKKQFGESDYRVREMFALMQKEDWEGTFEMRCLIHAISVNCPHTNQEDCEKARTNIEAYVENECERKHSDWKRSKCSHCGYLERIEKKWSKM